MPTKTRLNVTIIAPDAFAIPGLNFRGFRSEVDYPAMVAVIEGSKPIFRTFPTE